MKRKFFSLIIFLALVLTCGVTAYATDISIDGDLVQFNQSYGYPFIDSANRTQVPLRVTMEAAGCDVDWDAATRTAIVQKNGTKVEVPIGQQYILVNGVKKTNDTAALIKDSRTYLPIRAVLEAFGAKVDWDSTSQTVIVKTDSSLPMNMTVHFIDVGQGDATLIDYGTTEILIDAGQASQGSTVKKYISKYVDGKLDIVIATHPDADHIGGLPEIIKAFDCGQIIDSGNTDKTTATYANYVKAANEEGCPIVLDSDMNIDLGGGACLQIIETGDGHLDVNDDSVVCAVEFCNFRAFFAGDMSSSTENENLSKFMDVDILKLGHHGSYASTGTDFLNRLKPSVAIVSSGLSNSYGHPHKSTLTRLFNKGISVYGTFKSGTITATTNGYSYSLSTNKALTLEDVGSPGQADSSKPTVSTAPYIGNANSKKFHKSTCDGVKQMYEGNKVPYATREEAISDGYVPCKMCNP